jgi:hypothetical protein
LVQRLMHNFKPTVISYSDVMPVEDLGITKSALEKVVKTKRGKKSRSKSKKKTAKKDDEDSTTPEMSSIALKQLFKSLSCD